MAQSQETSSSRARKDFWFEREVFGSIGRTTRLLFFATPQGEGSFWVL
jgi:hypothetical protein